MNHSWIEAANALVASGLSPSLASVRYGTEHVHGAMLLPAIVSGLLMPLMLPRVGATVRRVFSADRRNSLETEHPGAPAGIDCVFDESMVEMSRKNARLARELSDLKAAYAALATEVAERTAVADRLHHLAHHDPLTGLPNRVLLMDRLGQALAHARRADTGILVIYLDLDNFKTINDTMGHAAGDRVLKEIGTRIAGCMRSADTASRIGGDEFVLICGTTDPAADAARLRSRLLRAIEAPIDVAGTPVTIGASIGVSAFPGDGSDAAELIDRADRAMYGAKLSSR